MERIYCIYMKVLQGVAIKQFSAQYPLKKSYLAINLLFKILKWSSTNRSHSITWHTWRDRLSQTDLIPLVISLMLSGSNSS